MGKMQLRSREKLACRRDKVRNEKKKKINKGATKQKAKCSIAEYYRRRREKIKATNPETYELAQKKERDRYAKRVSEGKIKMVADMTDREKRTARKRRKEYAAKYFSKKKRLQEEDRTPVASQAGSESTSAVDKSESHQRKKGKKAVRLRLESDKKRIQSLESDLKKVILKY